MGELKQKQKNACIYVGIKKKICEEYEFKRTIRKNLM